MLPLLAPILAQLITLTVGDRTEVHYVVGDGKYLDGVTRPLAGLNFGWRRTSVALFYTPSFTVIPLDREPRHWLTFQGGTLSATYRWRRTTATLSESAGYGEFAFQAQALADPGVNPAAGAAVGGAGAPATPGATPTTPGGTSPGGVPGGTTGTTGATNPQAANQVQRPTDQIVRYEISTTALTLTHIVSRTVTVGADTNYTVAGGLGASEVDYPLIKGERSDAYISHNLIVSRRDNFTSSLSMQYAVSSTRDDGWGAFVNELWTHKLSTRATSHVGVGLAGTRFSQENGTVGYSIYPTFNVGIVYFDRLAGGVLTLGANAAAAPYIDPLRATVDPRLSLGANAGWTKNRFSISSTAGAAISLVKADDNNGAVNSVGASLGAAYRLGAGFFVDGGASTAWQTFEHTTVIPASWTAFLGVTFGAQVPLRGH